MKHRSAVLCLCLVLCLLAGALPAAALPVDDLSAAYRASRYGENLSRLPRTGDPAFDVLAVALSQVGYHEGDGVGDFHGGNAAGVGNFTEYNRACGRVGGSYGYAWCAAFVSFCLARAGAAEAAGGRFVSCTLWVERLEKLGLFRTRASGYRPRAGDIVFFRSAGVTRASDHVGLVRGVSGGRVHTVEGNTSNAVGLRDYDLDDPAIVGYGCPRYGGTPLGKSAAELSGTVPGYYVVTASSLTLRGAASGNAPRLAEAKRGEMVRVFALSGGWGQVEYDGQCAFLPLDGAALAAPALCRVSYRGAGGEGCPTDTDFLSFTPQTVSKITPTRAGYAFDGWRDGTGRAYAAGDRLPAADTVLTAAWVALPAEPPPANHSTEPPPTENPAQPPDGSSEEQFTDPPAEPPAAHAADNPTDTPQTDGATGESAISPRTGSENPAFAVDAHARAEHAARYASGGVAALLALLALLARLRRRVRRA